MIRAALPEDAAALAALWNPWIRDTAVTFNSAEKSEADLLAMIAARECFLVYINNGVQGFATYSQFRGGPGYATCMEHSVILSPNARGMGAGRALMVAVEDHARAAGAHQMIAGVSGENPEGQRFHAALGYHEIAIIREAGFKFGRFMDLVLMQKFLS
ncbi:GNAT family N-acetyltransferase [Cypionkella psychrotolerans]|uniref:GNAT family N-acetyltransferase n=1 Tax=Cypionkella psychrotolerans TaxID=1678131 RepID=UPI0006B4B561|nr:GNAT family N-acetyltransferase [Cypionkella psychrotolerans]